MTLPDKTKIIRATEVCFVFVLGLFGGGEIFLFIYYTILPEALPSALTQANGITFLALGLLDLYTAIFLRKQKYGAALINVIGYLIVLLLYSKYTLWVIVPHSVCAIYLLIRIYVRAICEGDGTAKAQ